MVFPKVLVLITGLINLFIEVISNKDSEMDMESGANHKEGSIIKVIICLIENMGMASMIGLTAMSIREIL